ncbi:hypothetical protein B0I33_111300 [Prauserella shujinwangii]|uniref:Uncharacterized protein n=1 Tax=Prauserella shujinwangii TaxID=1453103 RepID=A0A2T0LNL6_9PSEU|nr:DUF6319 family protein [Prauserella shujinwangii]PRX44784.1 hypothetical protein B0I33_111300 [Prauserella shujinwangii]
MTVDSATQEREETTPGGPSDTSDMPESASAPSGAEDAGTPSASGTDDQQAEPAKPQRGRPKGSGARKTRSVELTLTVTGTADGEWQAELKHGSKWVARGLSIPAAAVSRAAKELHDELSGPIDEVINAAREQQQARVAQLEAELQQAKQALAELES